MINKTFQFLTEFGDFVIIMMIDRNLINIDPKDVSKIPHKVILQIFPDRKCTEIPFQSRYELSTIYVKLIQMLIHILWLIFY